MYISETIFFQALIDLPLAKKYAVQSFIEIILLCCVGFKGLYTMWKNENFTFTEEIFRQINSLLTSLVKTMLSRDLCQKKYKS